MINANKIKELISLSTNVVVTSHKNIDLDALGSILGLYYISKSLDKEVYIVIEEEKNELDVKRVLSTIKKLDNISPVCYKDLSIDNNTLLIIADTNRGTRIQSEKLLKIKNKVLIDHHVKTDESISDLLYEYVDIEESSATEIVVDLISELNVYIPSHIATIMLAGIYVDTNGFILKTNENTHLCASLLYKFGADTKESQYLLKQNFNEYKRRQGLIIKTEFYDNIAMAAESTNKYDSTELAKASDVLLTFNNINASFVIAKIDDNKVGISARSFDTIDVEKVMKHFGGGGHKTYSAAQIENKTVEEVKIELLKYLGV